MARAHVTALSIALTGDEPPSEFRIFRAGANETTKGTFVFDDAAAASVMSEYAEHGIDLMLDYDHASLGTGIDPALSGKAAGWFNIEVRNGELWAVNVRWTPPAAEALRRKEWRFMSPAFGTDDSGRVASLLNVALTNLPATRKLEPLMAANIIHLGGGMLDAATVKKALEALAGGDAEACMAILTDMIASAASGGETPAEEPAAELAEEPSAEEEVEEEAAAIMAATSRLTRLTGKTTIGAAVEEVERLHAIAVNVEKREAQLAKDREALEYSQRKENAITLTKLGAETPATTGLAKGKLCKRLLDEPLAEQTARAAVLLAAKGGKLPAAVKPPAEAVETHGLEPRELKLCAEKKIDPAVYAATRAGIRARNVQGV